MLPLQNECSSAMKILLEPLSEYFILKPGEKVEIHATFDERTIHNSFTVAPNDSFLTVYAPGDIAGFIDCYMMRDGIRLTPDGN
ncbi:hypothetical protein [Janthinobacterium sp. 1_2014MBL_MicDiv]|uniref:hypothetical protein n=1 Tax=Janthinobacterium sp. 1_2014MBL_MicDiv TaxID=1644131 RepID=UPI0012EBD8FF|nr:hypothetical protein [Janthinobacterium sp. 1_2014MBL_MicDiv]